MGISRRILVIHADARVRDRIHQSFRAPEFEFHGFHDGCDALLVLDELRPDLILSDGSLPDMDSWLFSQVVKRSPGLKQLPVIFFSAEAFDLAHLESRVRETLGLSPAAERVAEQELAAEPETSVGPSDDFFDMLLAHEAAVAQVGLHRDGPDAAPPPPVPFEGRFSKVEVAGKMVRVLTEARSRPTFMVVTAIERDGHKLRRIESSWPHPLDRFEDRPFVRREIDLQHERVLTTIADLIVEAPRRPFGPLEGHVAERSSSSDVT
jgi:CheY-like chemotaxis protein